MKALMRVLLLIVMMPAWLVAKPIKSNEAKLDIEEIEISMMKALKARDPQKELEENTRKGKLVFYCYGSFMYGYSVPGLSQEEINEFIDSKDYDIENHYQTDPMPVFQPDGYDEQVIEFMRIYNKLLLSHIKNKHIKSALTMPEAAPPES